MVGSLERSRLVDGAVVDSVLCSRLIDGAEIGSVQCVLVEVARLVCNSTTRET